MGEIVDAVLGEEYKMSTSRDARTYIPSATRLLLFVSFALALLSPATIAQSQNGNGGSKSEAVTTEEPPVVTSVDLFIPLEGAPAMGDESARVGIVEFADYQCPFCLMYGQQTFGQILANYVKTGKVRYFFKDLPITKLHPQAFQKAELARCAGEQGKYWEMHDRLISSPQFSSIDGELSVYAGAMGLDVPKLKTCTDNQPHVEQINNDIRDASTFGVRGTPSFFLGIVDPQTKGLKAVTMVFGAQAYTTFQDALDQVIASSIQQEKRSGESKQEAATRKSNSQERGRVASERTK